MQAGRAAEGQHPARHPAPTRASAEGMPAPFMKAIISWILCTQQEEEVQRGTRRYRAGPAGRVSGVAAAEEGSVGRRGRPQAARAHARSPGISRRRRQQHMLQQALPAAHSAHPVTVIILWKVDKGDWGVGRRPGGHACGWEAVEAQADGHCTAGEGSRHSRLSRGGGPRRVGGWREGNKGLGVAVAAAARLDGQQAGPTHQA